MNTVGSYLYRVDFMYRGEPYTADFCSTAEITAETDKCVAWDIASDAIKEVMRRIPNRQEGVYPHSIVITGEFGSVKVKE